VLPEEVAPVVLDLRHDAVRARAEHAARFAGAPPEDVVVDRRRRTPLCDDDAAAIDIVGPVPAAAVFARAGHKHSLRVAVGSAAASKTELVPPEVLAVNLSEVGVRAAPAAHQQRLAGASSHSSAATAGSASPVPDHRPAGSGATRRPTRPVEDHGGEKTRGDHPVGPVDLSVLPVRLEQPHTAGALALVAERAGGAAPATKAGDAWVLAHVVATARLLLRVVAVVLPEEVAPVVLDLRHDAVRARAEHAARFAGAPPEDVVVDRRRRTPLCDDDAAAIDIVGPVPAAAVFARAGHKHGLGVAVRLAAVREPEVELPKLCANHVGKLGVRPAPATDQQSLASASSQWGTAASGTRRPPLDALDDSLHPPTGTLRPTRPTGTGGSPHSSRAGAAWGPLCASHTPWASATHRPTTAESSFRPLPTGCTSWTGLAFRSGAPISPVLATNTSQSSCSFRTPWAARTTGASGAAPHFCNFFAQLVVDPTEVLLHFCKARLHFLDLPDLQFLELQHLARTSGVALSGPLHEAVTLFGFPESNSDRSHSLRQSLGVDLATISCSPCSTGTGCCCATCRECADCCSCRQGHRKGPTSGRRGHSRGWGWGWASDRRDRAVIQNVGIYFSVDMEHLELRAGERERHDKQHNFALP